MKYFSAQYVITNYGPPLSRPVICTNDEGEIISIEDTSGRLDERHSLEFHNGIIVPGFINCHCHLELSRMKGLIPPGTGLDGFLSMVGSIRNLHGEDTTGHMEEADREMAREGVVMCADICNTGDSFSLKKKSRIKYINLAEVFGIDSLKAEKRMEEISAVTAIAAREGVEIQLVPHSVYSVSLPLFRLIREKSRSNRVSSIHFLESEDEYDFIENHSGPLMDAYRKILSPHAVPDIASNHASAILEELTPAGSLILVHNTFIRKEIIDSLKKRNGIYYCLCPNSNKYIGTGFPPVQLLADEKCDIVIGTDSLASNSSLSILSEICTIQETFPSIPLEELIRWSTLNGARALGEEDNAGSIETGKKPGLVLIEGADLANMRLNRRSSARRLI